MCVRRVQPALAEKLPPQRQQGGAARRPTGTEQESWQGGGGARDALRPTGTEDSTSGGAAGHPCGARAAEERPHRAALLRGMACHSSSRRLWRALRSEAVDSRHCRLPPLSVARGKEARGSRSREEEEAREGSRGVETATQEA